MKKLIYTILPFTLILASTLVALQVIGGNSFTILKYNEVDYTNLTMNYTWKYYTIDIYRYIINIKNAILNKGVNGVFVELPTVPNPTYNDILAGFKWIANWFVYWFNIVIYVINWVFLVPLKLIVYPINIIETLMGIDTSNNDWIEFTNNIYNWQIPYIPYIQ